MKRFYKAVSVAPADANGAYGIELDGRRVKTPAKNTLAVPSRQLADAMAGEWQAQTTQIVPASMPLTSLAYTALDHIEGNKSGVLDQLAAYAETDLLCYFAGDDQELRSKQQAAWRPMIDWAAATLGVALKTTDNLMPVAQAPETRALIRQQLEAIDSWRLASLSVTTALSGSVILGLALAKKRLTADQVLAASTLDETHQAERWGADQEAAERRAHIAHELTQAERFLNLLDRG